MDTVEHAIRRVGWPLELQLEKDLDKFKRCAAPPESKIEEAFLVGLMGLNHFTHCFDFPQCPLESALTPEQLALRERRYEVYLQEPIGNYRADFVIRAFVKDQPCAAIVVECDGHNFHERTKEQAQRDKSRDRALMAAGYPVVRFTGSELYDRAIDCVVEAIQALRGAAKKK